jgi:hypothetical protein
MTGPRKVSWLIARLQELDNLHGIELIRRVEALRPAAREVFGAAYDRGVWEATHRGNTTREDVANELGTTVLYVQKRSSKHATAMKGSKQG